MTDYTKTQNFDSLIEKLVGLSMNTILNNDSTTIDSHIEQTKGITLSIGSPERELTYLGSPILAEDRIVRKNICADFEKTFN